MIEKQFSMVIDRSNSLLCYLILIHGLTLTVVLALLANIWLSFIAVILISTSFIYYCQSYQWLKSNRSIVKVGRDTRGRWTLFYADNTLQQKLNLTHCVVTSKGVMLYFSGTVFWNAPSITILADAIDAELFRQLRVYLRAPKTFLQ